MSDREDREQWLDLRIAAREDGAWSRARGLDEEEDMKVDEWRTKPRREEQR